MNYRQQILVMVLVLLLSVPGLATPNSDVADQISRSTLGEGTFLEPTTLSRELTGLRFDNTTTFAQQQPEDSWEGEEEVSDFREGSNKPPGHKSPFKAFVLSLAVPGAGQWYYGSKTKALLFFAVDVAAWGLHIKWHGDGVDMEDEFEAFNRQYWSRERYEQQYLQWAYGFTDDDLITEGEVSHHLPDTRTQQYYEMTGKYDQFSWGWADAMLNDSTLSDYSDTNPPPRITSTAVTPESALRFQYETMR
ncbi:hypothetical protein GF420_07460, partial [candidate division GN15 bacterium]|nr:hypothetical protein [candidate division GN15 bacterium]